jgi:hypothetical protein
MRTKNKMKDSKVESEEWWNGCRGIFYKGIREESSSA